MYTVAIICEYNPFHKGHKHHIDEIRRSFGEDTAIIAIMSGNYTQRGELAIIDKAVRAECAVLGGVNLVLELPFPYSVASAELFATAGVTIADSLGVVDYLSFGSESGNAEHLTELAELMLSKEYENTFKQLSELKENADKGYPLLCELALRKLVDGYGAVELSPNNLLAIEYIKALKRTGSSIKPHTVKRIGADFTEDKITGSAFESATAIRNMMIKDFVSATDYVPLSSVSPLINAYKNRKAPTNEELLSSAVLSKLRLNSSDGICDIHDLGGGLYNRLIATSYEATNIKELVDMTSTKKYTRSRIKRAIWYSLVGVTSSDVKNPPLYTQILAMDSRGASRLRSIRKHGGIITVTRPSEIAKLPNDVKHQGELSLRADAVYQMAKPVPDPGSNAYRFTPYVKKDD